MPDILKWVLLTGGLAVIIAAFLIGGADAPRDILWLNIVVTCIVFISTVFGVFQKLQTPGQQHQPQMSSLGIRIVSSWIYAILAFGGMLVMYYGLHSEFSIQLIYQGAALLALVFGYFLGMKAEAQSDATTGYESVRRNGLEMMRSAVRLVEEQASFNPNVPANVRARIGDLSDRLRYIAPCDEARAREYEDRFCALMDTVSRSMADYSLNAARIDDFLGQARLLIDSRKNVYSTY